MLVLHSIRMYLAGVRRNEMRRQWEAAHAQGFRAGRLHGLGELAVQIKLLESKLEAARAELEAVRRDLSTRLTGASREPPS